MFSRVSTIQQLENDDWGDPEPGDSFLVRRCTELRRKPLSEFTVENLRIMLGQQIAAPILLPMALDVLVKDPLAEGDFYPGDLLASVLRLPADAWASMPSQRERLSDVLAAVDLQTTDLPQNVHDAVLAAKTGHDTAQSAARSNATPARERKRGGRSRSRRS
jgi:hypothetical protein